MILAAGLGTRMRPLTRLLAKPALPVLDRPLLHWTLDALAAAGVREVAINTHHLPATVRDAVGSGRRWGMRVTWSHERAILGTGGGPRRLRAFFGDEPCLLVNGDVLFRFDLRPLLARRGGTGAPVALGLIPNPDPRRYSAVVMDGRGRVRAIAGQPRAASGRPWLFTGIHLIDPALLDRLPRGPSDSVRDLYIPMLREGERVEGVPLRGAWYDLGAPPLYLASQLAMIRTSRVPGRSRGSLLGPEAAVNDGATVRRSVVGRATVIGRGAVVEDSVLWAGSRIGAGCVVRGSIVAGAALAPGARVEDAIVLPGPRARVQPMEPPAR
jgi:NDP-sugar pyrophosphorylase family protein